MELTENAVYKSPAKLTWPEFFVDSPALSSARAEIWRIKTVHRDSQNSTFLNNTDIIMQTLFQISF